MPIYEYQCQACGHQFETTQRITEDPLKECPECHKPQLERLISSTAFLLKGGGWYKDGYGSSSGKPQRTENQVTDRLTKAINDDKKKTAEAAAETAAASSASEGSASGNDSSSAPSGSSGGSSSSGSSSGTSSSGGTTT